MKCFVTRIALALALLHPGSAATQTPAAFTRILQREMQAQHIPALSVLVFKGDRVLFEATLGKADIAQNSPLTPAHTQR